MIQLDLLQPTPLQQFEHWRVTPGGKRILRHIYAITAAYAARYHRTGRPVSFRLIWELTRDRLPAIRATAAARGIEIKKLDGFTLNDHCHAHVARHILAHRPDWSGLFELRELGAARTKRRIIVIEEKQQQAA
jgi:hypothetical protein